ACALPLWKVTAFIGTNIVTAQVSTGQMQCKVYDSMLALPQDLQAARALIVISVLGALGLLPAVAGGRCTNCVEDEAAKVTDAQRRELGRSGTGSYSAKYTAPRSGAYV
uniref:Uncharacterized protein n=1 Tax=Denticeps clupeoides TaxID=299321 RepID=A0AAY4DH75_9TELE